MAERRSMMHRGRARLPAALVAASLQLGAAALANAQGREAAPSAAADAAIVQAISRDSVAVDARARTAWAIDTSTAAIARSGTGHVDAAHVDTAPVDPAPVDTLPAFAPTPPGAMRTAIDSSLVARALGLDVVIDPRLVPPPDAWRTARFAAARDIGAQAFSWCRDGARGRRVAQWSVAATFVGGNLGLYEYFRRAWWSGQTRDFWVNWDWGGDFRDQDKLGHFLGGYVLAEAGRELLEAACMSERRAAVWGAIYSAAFQLQIEIWDARQAMYGFSPPDLLFNTIGQGTSLLHAFVPVTRAVLPTFSYNSTVAMERTRAGTIASPLRPSVDYSGQTYWLSVDVDTLLPQGAKRWWPDLLRFSLGHTITDFVSPETGLYIRAQRRFLLSLDLDPLKLPGRAPWWVATKKLLRHYRFPAPAIEIMSTGVRGIPWHR